jgi:hypothetical protein
MAGVRRPGVGEQCADPGVRAVGADQQVIRRGAAIGEVQQDADQTFRAGLDFLLDGIEARVSR